MMDSLFFQIYMILNYINFFYTNNINNCSIKLLKSSALCIENGSLYIYRKKVLSKISLIPELL